MNDASQWRLDVASELATHYANIGGVDSVLAVSSTARGHSDRYSDIDVFVFWKTPPQDEERASVVPALNGDMVRLFAFDPTWKCWSDMFTLGRNAAAKEHSGVATDVAHYVVSDVEEIVRSIALEHATDEPAHNLAVAIDCGISLYGEALIARWKAAIRYTDALAGAMVSKHGQMDYFWRWKSSIERGNNVMMLNENLTCFQKQLLQMLLALNKVYYFGFGWIDQVIERLTIAPKDFASRFKNLWQLDPSDHAAELSALIEESYDLVEKHLPEVDVARLRQLFRYERTFWDCAPPGLIED